MDRKYITTLKESPLFKSINSGNIDQLVICMNSTVIEYKSGEVVAVEGTKLDGIGVVLEGMLSIGKTSMTGSRIVMGTVGKGELFGETAAFTKDREWTAPVEASTDSKVLVSREAVLQHANGTEPCRRTCWKYWLTRHLH